MILIKSYLIHTRAGKAESVSRKLNRQDGQEATPSDTHDLVILVTEAPDNETESNRKEHIKKDQNILNMTLVSAFS